MHNKEEWFVHGQTFSKVFLTQKGWISVSADIRISGTTLYMDDLDYVPLDTVRITIGVSGNLAIRRQLLSRAREEGYGKLVIAGIRVSGRIPNRPIRYERSV